MVGKHIVCFFLTYLSWSVVTSQCHVNYSAVPAGNGFNLFRPAATPFMRQLDTAYQIRAIAYCTALGTSCLSSYYPNVTSIFTLDRYRHTDPNVQTLTNQTLAMLAGFRYCLWIIHPEIAAPMESFYQSVGLDISCTATGMDDPQATCNYIGQAFTNFTQNDGWNTDGSLNGDDKFVKYNRKRYQDYSGYRFQNPLYGGLSAPNQFGPKEDDYISSQVHPAGANSGTGQYWFNFEGPHLNWTKVFGYSPAEVNTFVNQFPGPRAKWGGNSYEQQLYIDQMIASINESANLNDTKKLMGELFDNKVGLATATFAPLILGTNGPLTGSKPWNDLDQLYFLTGVNIATLNAVELIWGVKRKFNSIRPLNAIQNFYKNINISAWGGIGQAVYQGASPAPVCHGTVHDMPGQQFQSYLRTMPFPDYTSGTCCYCQTVAQFAREVFHSDTIPLPVVYSYAKGASTRDPGCVPSAPLNITVTKWSDWAQKCCESRLWISVHFKQAVDDSTTYCPAIGAKTFAFYQAYWTRSATAAVDPLDRNIF